MSADAAAAVTLGEAVLGRYARVSLYNSPYPAHAEGRAVDCYPEPPDGGRTTGAPSPVGGTVLATETVRAPPKPYAPARDHLVLIDCDAPAAADGLVARLLHVDPAVEAGDRVEPGDSLGRLVRAGFFAPWVDNHLHVGFRRHDQHLRRASGSLPIDLDAPLEGLGWDGTGTVMRTGETYATLDAPTHPDPGGPLAGIRTDRGGVLDGGLPHYDGGGILGRSGEDDNSAPVSLGGDRLGVATGRHVAWDDVVVTANGEPVIGLSLCCARDDAFGAKLICPDREFAVGERVRVRVTPARG